MITLQTKIIILEAIVMTVEKYGSKTGVLQKLEEDMFDVFQRNCLRNVLGTRLTESFKSYKSFYSLYYKL